MGSFEEHMSECEKQLHAVDAEIAKLDKMTAGTEGHISPSFAQKLGELREHRMRLHDKLEELRREEAQAWEKEEFRAGFFHVWDDVGKRIQELIDHLRKGH